MDNSIERAKNDKKEFIELQNRIIELQKELVNELTYQKSLEENIKDCSNDDEDFTSDKFFKEEIEKSFEKISKDMKFLNSRVKVMEDSIASYNLALYDIF